MRRNIRHGYFSRLAIRHPFGRWFPLLLVALQIVAPLWHVCEMGGNCDDCKPQNGVLVCHRATQKADAAPQKTDAAAPRCKLCKPAKNAVSSVVPTVVFIGADNRRGGFKGTCLARELMSMARVTVAPLVLHFQITRVRAPRPKRAPRREVFAFELPLSRGPPAPFVV